MININTTSQTKTGQMTCSASQLYNEKVTMLEQFFNLSRDMICVLGMDGYFKKVSPAFAGLLGYSESELLSKPYSWYMCSKDLTKTVYNDNYPCYFENSYKAIDGNEIWLSWQLSKPTNDNLIYVIARDINDLKKAEHKAREYARQLEVYKNENLESLRYAERLQSTIMPDKDSLGYYFPESFMFFQPKQGVSGDFFWFDNHDDNTIMAVADCTGHGIPGAMLSVLGVNILHNAFRYENLHTPSVLAKKLDYSLWELLRHRFTGKRMDDGMDISLCSVDRKNMTLQYINVNNPIYIIRNGALVELKPQRYTIGSNTHTRKIEMQEFQLFKGDQVYLLSDGFPDQFGGPLGKKFGYPSFRKLLVEQSKLPMKEQKAVIEKIFTDWTGNNEQTDDVSIMGLKV